MAVKTVNPSSAIEHEHSAIGKVLSKDGTAIGYRQVGQGEGLIILHGMMSSGQNHSQLAELLADTFTVYLPDRRGRGLSGPYSPHYRVQDELDDLEAVLTKTGARYVFGVSAGAIIALEAALTLPTIQKVAVFEPPLLPDPSIATTTLARFDQEMAQGKVAAALITAMKGAQMGPAFFNLMPRRLMEFLTGKYMASEEKKSDGRYVLMKDLAPTLHYDFQLVAETGGHYERFKALQQAVLLLGVGRSSIYFKEALDNLERVLPHATRIEFPKLDHSATWNTDLRGQPQPIADALRRFFE